MGGRFLVWWEIKIQDDIDKKCKIVSSWYKFTISLKKQFYPLGYMQQAIMDWKNLIQGKVQNVQECTQVFRKKSLALGIQLYTQETLLKYIGGFHAYLRNSTLMFNPSNFDEVCVQETHIEIGGRNIDFRLTSEVPPTKSKRNGKEKRVATMKKEE